MSYRVLERPLLYELQGTRETITANILNISKLTENHLITKKHNNVYTVHQATCVQSWDLFSAVRIFEISNRIE